jgi:hypothetical protein
MEIVEINRLILNQGGTTVKEKSFYIKLNIAITIIILMINLLTSQYRRKYEILDISAVPNSNVPHVLLFLDILLLITILRSWWLIIYWNKSGIWTISILTTVVLGLIAYWWLKC